MDKIEPTAFLNIDDFHYKHTYKKLCPSEGGIKRSSALFPTMWELFVWGAILGYINDYPKPINKRYPSPPMRWQVIKEPHNKILQVLAVQSVKSFNIIKTPDELKKNIEDHSNGGLHLMHERMALNRMAYQSIESLIDEIMGRLKT